MSDSTPQEQLTGRVASCTPLTDAADDPTMRYTNRHDRVRQVAQRMERCVRDLLTAFDQSCAKQAVYPYIYDGMYADLEPAMDAARAALKEPLL